MTFKPLSTDDDTTQASKTLLYALAGGGKTYQAKKYQEAFGKGFILSGESGLGSIRDVKIDYLPFVQFRGTAPDGKYSFEQICRIMMTPEFKAQEYKWIMLDSLTELSDQVYAYCQAEATRTNQKNGFKLWGDYADGMISACKWIRDLPYHVVVSCLLKQEQDENGNILYFPLVKGNAVSAQLNGLFDNVFALSKVNVKNPDGSQTIKRLVITDSVNGYNCKNRDPSQRLSPIEETDDVASLIKRIIGDNT